MIMTFSLISSFQFFSPFLQGFDEYMNLVLDEAEEVSIKKNTRKQLGESSLFLDSLFDNKSLSFYLLSYGSITLSKMPIFRKDSS